MEELLEISRNLIDGTRSEFKRYLFGTIQWQNRLIGIKGARGTGKTTLLLQWLKSLDLPNRQQAYFSLDELYFTTHTLVDTIQSFYQHGGKVLVLDEVHKYPTWAKEIKNLYDRYPDLQIVFTGSSIIDLSRQEGDLSRRALLYELKGLSYREYLEFVHHVVLPVPTMDQLLSPDIAWTQQYPKTFKPLAYFQEYLRYGYYPFSASDKLSYYSRLRQLVRAIVEYDMAELKGFDIRHARKMLQLLYVIAQQVPFKPNINSLAEKTGIHRNSINNYLYFLNEARLLSLLNKRGISVAILQKPEMILMENTNLLYALADTEPDSGTVREVFFNSQLQGLYTVRYSDTADFEIDNNYTFEVGGRAKGNKQLKSLADAWTVKDNLEYPVGRSLPLWSFGFLY